MKPDRPLGLLPHAALQFSLAACAALPPAFTTSFEPVDAEVAAELEHLVAEEAAEIEGFFALSYREQFALHVLPDRRSFDASFPAEWGMGETACWMVASGVATDLRVLSPRAWTEDACEHDAGDRVHVRNLIAHELVHVLHGQHNPTRDFTGMDNVAWFAEGLAAYASGQLEEGSLADPREAVAAGLAPARLEDAWSGKYRYGISGSLVRFLDEQCGRGTLRAMLAATSEVELLALAGLTEADLLARWAADLLAREPARAG